MRVSLARVTGTIALAALAGCGRARAVNVQAPPAPVVGTTEDGVANWYGEPYHGRPTSSGETYDMNRLTAAHRTLPFGTRVRVRHAESGRQVEVRINDRGPFVEDRVIDLSRAAGRQIGLIGSGTARVRLRILGLPETISGGFFVVQVGSFRSRDNAERLRQELAERHGVVLIRSYDSASGRFYRVLAGREAGQAGAEALASQLRMRGYRPLVVRVDEPSL